MVPSQPDPLAPALEQAEAELRRQLGEVCEARQRPVSAESTGELLRLEEALVSAADAAKRAVSLRRRRRVQVETDGADAAASVSDGGGAAAESVREFGDRDGRSWRVWAVTPDRARGGRAGDRHLGEYCDGWLAFECLEGEERKRLPQYPEDWAHRTDAELEQLLGQAVAPRRRATERSAGDEPRA